MSKADAGLTSNSNHGKTLNYGYLTPPLETNPILTSVVVSILCKINIGIRRCPNIDL